MQIVVLVKSLPAQLRLFALCFLLCTSVYAEDLLTERAYWEDSSGVASIEQAKAASFTRYQGVLSRGFTKSATWLRLGLTPDAGTDPSEKLIVRIRPVYLDEITLYDPLDHNSNPRVTGDTTDFKKQEYRSLAHTFVIPAGEAPRNIYLRLKATSTSLIHVEVFTQTEMVNHE